MPSAADWREIARRWRERYHELKAGCDQTEVLLTGALLVAQKERDELHVALRRTIEIAKRIEDAAYNREYDDFTGGVAEGAGEVRQALEKFIGDFDFDGTGKP